MDSSSEDSFDAFPDESNGRSVLLSAAHDLATSLFVVAYWAGMWSLLDAFTVNEYASGCAALFLVMSLTLVKADQLLETTAAACPTMIQAVLVWLWTGFLAVLSIVIWRLGFFCVHIFLLPGNNLHAILVAALGVAILVSAGRYRSASGAPPVGVVADNYSPGLQFNRSTFSGHKLTDAGRDVLSTIPVVFVWVAIWTVYDNLALPVVLSGLISCAWIIMCAIFPVGDYLRDLCVGRWPVPGIADFLWTLLMTVAVIGMWRGAWDTTLAQLDLAQAPQAAVDQAPQGAAVLLVGAIGLTLLQRHRSAMFPPVDFNSDDGDHFHPVGSYSGTTTFDENHGKSWKTPDEKNRGSSVASV